MPQVQLAATDEASATGTAVKRRASIDVFRGIVMFLMLAEVLELMKLVEHFPEQAWAEWLRFSTTHVPWVGCSLHDMIQPSFSFLVGVSLPFSLRARRLRGKSFKSMAWHAISRSLILIFLGIGLRSLGHSQTNFFFVDTLTQIGLGYFFLFLFAWLPVWIQAAAVALILLGYWAFFATSTLPPDGFDPSPWGVAPDWPHLLSGFEAHWNMNMNPAHDFDLWFMNLFPRDEEFTTYSGGYTTLSFIPTLGTMLLGLIAGEVLLRAGSVSRTSWLLFLPGLALFALGWAIGHYGYCPIVKKVWTPSWVLYSGGLCFLALGLLYWICDVWEQTWWAWPVVVIGANSIVAYVMSWTLEGPIKAFLRRHFGESWYKFAGEAWEHALLGSGVLLVMWLVLYWLYRQRIFVRI